jgi:hypothetical protein
MPYLATSPTKGLDGRVYISGSDEPDIVKRHITDRSDRMNQRQNSERLKFMVRN